MEHKSFRQIGSSLAGFGALTVLAGSTRALQASLTGQGSVIEDGLRAAAPELAVASNGIELIAFGALMMLIGFGLHAMIVMREREPRPVPVKVVKRSKKKTPEKKERTTRRPSEVIVIRRIIRF